MKHLLLVFVSMFSHHHEAKPELKPALDVHLLDRTVAQLDIVDTDKTICVYPVSGK